MPRYRLPSLSVLSLVLAAAFTSTAHAQTSPMAPDIPADKFTTTVPNADYVKQEVMRSSRNAARGR